MELGRALCVPRPAPVGALSPRAAPNRLAPAPWVAMATAMAITAEAGPERPWLL
jgi:hypothetical protein